MPGLIESLARPGGNITGTTSMLPDLGGKQVELLHQGASPTLQSAADAARRLGLELVVVDVVTRQDFEPAFARIEQSQAGALLVAVEGLIFNNRQAVIAFAARRRLPALYSLAEPVRDGGLMSYGTNINVHYTIPLVSRSVQLKGSRLGRGDWKTLSAAGDRVHLLNRLRRVDLGGVR